MRIDKFFSDCGIFTRSEIQKALKSHRIVVNGKIITRADFMVDDQSNVELDGEKVTYQKEIYCLFNIIFLLF